MAAPEKRKVSAKQIIADIRSGLDDTQLQRKYGLSDRSLETVYQKLAAAGALSEAEIRNRGVTSPSSNEPHRGPAHDFLWYCPACHQGQECECGECPACGVVVAKFLSRQAGKASVEPASLETIDYPESGASKGWAPVVWSVVLVVAVGAALLIWSRHRADERPKIAAIDPGVNYMRSLGAAKQVKPARQDAQEADAESAFSTETTEDLQNYPDASEQIPIPEPSTRVGVTERAPARESRESITEPRRPATNPQEPRERQRTYATGTLRQFTSSDFKQEVVDASRVYPVLFQFYSHT